MPLGALTILDHNGNAFDSASIPRELITGTGAVPKPRLRVDVAQTSFFEGREFRSFKEFNVAAGATLWMRFTISLDFILFQQQLTILGGNVTLRAYSSGTATGVWSAAPIIGKNRMSERPTPLYTSSAVFDSGGNVTPGTIVDVTMVASSLNGNSTQSNSTGSAPDDERGLPAGAYYLGLSNAVGADPAVGVYSLAWEERQPGSVVVY